jgi:protein gp37
MAESTIEWTDYTFNPWIGCAKVSPGCAHCYAERTALQRTNWKVVWGGAGSRVRTSSATWKNPYSWNKKATEQRRRFKVFCASLADVFEDNPSKKATAVAMKIAHHLLK